MNGNRIETDSLGDKLVPHEAYYGAQTQRAIENFPFPQHSVPKSLIRTLGLVKYACAVVNRDLGRFHAGKRPLNDPQVQAILDACREVQSGAFAEQFLISTFQTGSGTSTHVNVNEVIANRAIELAGGDRYSAEKMIHPLDHVNLGQSSNDVFPTAIHVAMATAVRQELIPALAGLNHSLQRQMHRCHDAVKIGRTHLMDATPIRVSDELSGFARQVELAGDRAAVGMAELLPLAIGGTAVGTGLNTTREFGARVAAILESETQIPFVEARNHFEACAARDSIVSAHGQLCTIAVSLFHIADNLRWLASGPRCGFGELTLPKLQPGSSLMPGKANPVICESVMQVAARVLGNNHTVGFAGATGGHFQLNVMMPILAHASLESIDLLAIAARNLDEKCVQALEVNRERCSELVERSTALVTALTPLIGYDAAANIAAEALRTGKTIRQVCHERSIAPATEIDRILDAVVNP